ncbi:YciI family protein [Larkinella soli]|uniref:YciI family protein n=1 Tax=Larkinella soli TaxID=1770527 RepID=UPI000FFB74C3|nr:YciI family protein [Larkinella soli]
MLYVIHAYDYTDEQALDRRMAVRPRHFDGARSLKAQGHFILGGALLDPAGKMIGSMMLLDFENEAQLDDWLQNEVYVTGKVWERIDIKPFRQADI